MPQWYDISRSEDYKSLSPEEKAQAKSFFFQKNILPSFQSDPELNDGKVIQFAFDEFMSIPDDTGQGYITSMLGAAGRGFGEVVPGVVEGVGALTGIEPIQEVGQDIRAGLEYISPVNPIYAESVPVKLAGVGGQIGSVLATGGIGGAAGRALAAERIAAAGTQAARQAALTQAVQRGAQTALLGTAAAQGAAEGAQQAEQYGMTGPEAYLRTLAGAATEVGTELLPFGMAAETALAKRALASAPRTTGFVGSTLSEGGEEALAQIGSNIATQVLAPAGVETPGITEGALEAGLYGAAGGAMLGGVNALISTPPERQTESQQRAAAEFNARPVDAAPPVDPRENLRNSQDPTSTPVVTPDGAITWLPAVSRAITPTPPVTPPVQTPSQVEQKLAEYMQNPATKTAASLVQNAAQNPDAAEAAKASQAVIENIGASVVSQPVPAPTPITPAPAPEPKPLAELPTPSPLTGQPTAPAVGTATPTTLPEDAIQEQITDAGVLRQEGPEMELQGVGEGNVQPEEVAGEGEVEAQEEVAAQPPAAEVPPQVPQPSPNLPALVAVRDNTATPEQVQSLVDQGLVEQVGDQNIITEAGVAAMPEGEKPRLTPAQRRAEVEGMAAPVVRDVTKPEQMTPEEWVSSGRKKGTQWASIYPAIQAGKPVNAELYNQVVSDVPEGYVKDGLLYRRINLDAPVEQMAPDEVIIKAIRESEKNKEAKKIFSSHIAAFFDPNGLELEGYAKNPELVGFVKKTIQPSLDILKQKFGETIRLYRAESQFPTRKAARTIFSWSSDPAIAKAHASGRKGFVVKSREIPINLIRWIGNESEKEFLISNLDLSILDKKPITSRIVNTYGITLPEGYVKQGDLYIFQPTAAEKPTPDSVAVEPEAPAAQPPAAEPVTTEVTTTEIAPTVTPEAEALVVAETKAQETTNGLTDVQPQIDSVIDGTLSEEEKSAAAKELGATSWNTDALKLFKQTLADWSVGAKQVSARLAAIFQKVLDSARSALLAIGIFIGSGVNTERGIAPIQTVTENIPAPNIAQDMAAVESQVRNRLAATPDAQARAAMTPPRTSMTEGLAAAGTLSATGVQLPAVTTTGEVPLVAERQAPLVKRANFNGAAASTDASLMADWIVSTNDNKGKPFIVGDKTNGALFVFDGEGNLVRKTPALFGMNVGDQAPVDSDKERITPSGRFESAMGYNVDYYGSLLDFYQTNINNRLAIHKVYLKEPEERRQQRLDSQTPADNRISYGCINVDEQVFNRDIAPAFAGGGIVYILPETQKGRSAFVPLSLYDSSKVQPVSTAESKAQEKADKKAEKTRSDGSRASLARLVAGERGNPVFGNVTMDDGIEALRQLDEAGDLPNIFFTEITTTQEFLSKPENEQSFPDTWAALSAGGKAEGMEEKGTAFVFIDNVGVTNLDRKLATQFGTTPEVAAVRRVAVHESIHKAISFLNESEQIALFRYMRELYSPEQLDVLAETYTNFANWRESKSSYLNLIEESLTRTIDSMDSLPKDGILGEFIQWLKGIWRKITGKKGEPTLNDLKDVMRLIRNGLRNSTKARADRTISGGVVRYSAVAPQAPATDAEYLAAVEAGDSGNDNLNQLLRDASPDERQAVVDSWIKRNPRAAARMQRMVDEAARATIPPIDRISVFDVRGKPVEVIKNATRRERKSLESDGMVGEILLPTGDTLSFNRMNALHGEVLNRLGIRKAAVVTGLLYPDSFLVTDRTSSELSENPSTPARIRAKYRVDEVGFYNDAIVGPWEDLPQSPTPLDPVTYDDNGNIIPPPQRFQPISPDIRFSLPTLVSESASAFSSGQQAARAISFTPRQLDVYMAVLGAFSTLRRKGKQSATMQELFDAANTLVSGITPNEFSETLQGLYNDNAALLNPGDSTFQVFNRDGELAGAVVLVAKDTSRASLIPPEEVKGITDKLTSDMDKAVTEGEQSPFEGLSFTGNVPKMHARVNFRNVEKAAEDFVNQMIRSRKEKGRTYIEALIDIADMVATDNFAKEYIGGAGMESQGLVLQAIPPPLNNKIYAAQMTNISEADRVRLEDAYRKVSLYYEGIGTVGGTLQGYRAWTATRGKYGWLLDSWKADALKTAEYAVNAQMGGSVSVKINQDLNDAVTGVGKAVADEVGGIVEEDQDAIDLAAGEATLDEKQKSAWERFKDAIRTKGLIAKALKAIRDKKAGSKARASLSAEERNIIFQMTEEELLALDAQMDKVMSDAEKIFFGRESPAGTPEQRATREKLEKMVNTAKKRVDKGKDIDVAKDEEPESSEEQVSKAERTAQAILKDLSERYADPMLLSEKESKINEMRELYKQRVRQGVGPEQMTEAYFVNKAKELGADETTAGILWKAAELEIDARETMRQDKILQRRAAVGERADAQAHRIIFATERLKRQSGFSGIDTNPKKDTIIQAFRDQVKNPVSIENFIARLQGLNVSKDVANRLFKAAEREKIDLEAMAQWRANERLISKRLDAEVSDIVAEQADNPVSIEEFAKKLSQFNLTPKQVKRYFDIAARAAVRRVEINNEKAKRIIYERGDIRPDVAEKDVDGDTVIEAFRDQVNSPTEEQAFLERLSKLGVAENVAKDLFNTAARERRDRQRTRVFDMIEGKNAIQKMLREIALARRGIEMPLRNPIPWTELLSKPAKSVDEYRQRVLDGILANPDMESVDNDVKERIADMFTDLWQEQVDKAVNRVIDNYTLQLDRAQRRQAGEALNKSRSKVIQHLNLGVLSNDAFIRILGEKFGIKMDMTKEERRHIESLLATLQDESLPKNKRNQASDDLASALMQYTKVGWSARLSLFWAMSVLAGWNTMLAIGMSFMNGANIILVRTPIGILSKMVQGDFKGALDVTFDSLNDMKRYLEAFPEAVDRAWGYITSGKVDLLEAEAAAPDRLFKSWDSLAKYRKVADQMVQDPKMLVRWMGTFMRMIGRIMTALDGFNTIVTKRGHLSMAVRLVAPDKEAFDRIIAKGSIEHYRQMLLASDPYFANMTPEKRRLLNSTAEAMMYQAMNEEGAKLENADFYASESAFTMDPSGLGGMIYGAIKKAEETSKSFAERNLAEKRLEAQGADRLSLENAKLAAAYITHFLAYNAVNYVGLRFARFAANKFNQGLSFIPFLGMTRFWEKSNSKLVDRQEAFTEMIYRNQAVGAVFAILGVMLIRALDEEPDDEKRGWFINGGLENVPTAQRRQLQEGGKLQYRLGVKINGRWLVFSYQNWPWSQLFSALGSTSDMIRFSPEKWREKGTSDILLSVAASGLTSTLDLPALQGLGTVLGRSISSSDPAEDFWTNIGAASANWVGGFIPKPLMDLDYILDSNRRKYTTIWEKTAGVVPFYRRYVGEDYYNIFGDPIKRNALPGSREFLLGPTEPAYKILGALNSRDIWLTPANAEQRMVGKGRNRRRLTQQEADAYSLETGKAYKTMILRYGPRALKMSPERARAFLSDKADEVRDRVLMKVYRGYRSRPSLTESR